jgi:hypothetical protein
MNAENRYYLGLWEYGKRQLYGSALRSVQTIDLNTAYRRLKKPHSKQEGIKRGGVARGRKFFRGQATKVLVQEQTLARSPR